MIWVYVKRMGRRTTFLVHLVYTLTLHCLLRQKVQRNAFLIWSVLHINLHVIMYVSTYLSEGTVSRVPSAVKREDPEPHKRDHGDKAESRRPESKSKSFFF